MTFAEFEALKDSRDKDIGVTYNSLNKTEKSFNCKLTVAQAVTLATCILQKAQILIDEQIPDGAVKLWNIGDGKLLVGLDPASGPRRTKAIAPTPANSCAKSKFKLTHYL